MISLLQFRRFSAAPVTVLDYFQPLVVFVLLRKKFNYRAEDVMTEEDMQQCFGCSVGEVKNKLCEEFLQQVHALQHLLLPALCRAYFTQPAGGSHHIASSSAAKENGLQPILEVTGESTAAPGHKKGGAGQGPGQKRPRTESVAADNGEENYESTFVEDETYYLLVSLLQAAVDVYSPPFACDAEFLEAMEALIALEYKVFVLDKHFSSQDAALMTAQKIDILLHATPVVNGMARILRAHVDRRVRRMPRPPRVIRLAERLKLTEKETNALVFLATAQSGSALTLLIDRLFSPVSLALWNRMNATELYHFVRDDRLHIHQGLIVVSEISCLPDSKILLPQEAAAALSGAEATHEQMAKLEKTALGDLLLSERASSQPLDDEGTLEPPVVEEKDDGEDGEDEEEVEAEGDGDDAASVESSARVAGGSPLGKKEVASSGAEALLMENMHVPYRNNFECMEASFHVISLMVKIRNMEGDIKEEEERGKRKKDEAVIRGMEGKLRIAQSIHASRVQATKQSGTFVPAIEALSDRFHLSDLEKNILLLMVGNAISHDVLVAINGRYFMREGQRFMTVGYIIFVLCKGLQQRVEARQAFYHSSRLISNSILSLSVDPMSSRSCFNTDLMEYTCDIDRKIVDLVMGRETESQEMVPGSSVIIPNVSLDKVVLPRNVMDKVLSRVEHFNLVNECKKKYGFGVGLGDSTSGLVILFYGPSGTGKTMFAHAIAGELKKKLLLVNVSIFKGAGSAPDMMRFIFREAKLRDAIILFDECEELFSVRSENPILNTLLVEFEKYDGMILMATNAAQCFDEAMNRRIALMVEFKPPDHSMRHQIWLSHIPSEMTLADDVSIEKLALNYELTGGLIRNAVLAAINNAVSREKTASPTLRLEDFETGAKQQLRGFFMAASDVANRANYVTPRRRLSDLVMDAETMSKIDYVAKMSKSRSTLFSLWGFNEENAPDQGSIYLFHGPSGTGKSMAAEGIAYECGLTIRVCNAATLLRSDTLSISSISTVFEEAKKLGAIVVIDESQCFFQHAVEETIVGIIMYYALRHSKPVILIATTEPQSFIDLKRHKIPITLEISFGLPKKKERLLLWKQVFPSGVPLDSDIDVESLSEYPISAKQIERISFRVCCRTAMLAATSRSVSMKMLKEELEEELRREQAKGSMMSMFA